MSPPAHRCNSTLHTVDRSAAALQDEFGTRASQPGVARADGQGNRGARSIHVWAFAPCRSLFPVDRARHRLGGNQVERVRIAALLHDVGKIHEIYAPLLQKPEKLTPAEWEVMQGHPIKSSELVMTVSHLADIVLPVRHHHENWDGSGYPDGFAGEQIPLASTDCAIRGHDQCNDHGSALSQSAGRGASTVRAHKVSRKAIRSLHL